MGSPWWLVRMTARRLGNTPLAASPTRDAGRWARRAAWALCLTPAMLAILAGCDDGKGVAPPARPPVRPGKGVIVGTVTLAGPVPVMRELGAGPCHPGAGTISVKDESVVADDAGRLANVVVYVKDGPPVDVPAGGPV